MGVRPLMYRSTGGAIWPLRRFGADPRSLDWRQVHQLDSDYPVRTALCGRRSPFDARPRASVETTVDPDDWTILQLAVDERARWRLEVTAAQATTVREYLSARRILMLTISGGPRNGPFYESMRLVFPERPIVEMESRDPIFHTVYDLDDRYQFPAVGFARHHLRNDGPWRTGGHLRRSRPGHGGMSFNSDIGDSWDGRTIRLPREYPRWDRIGVNYWCTP